MSQALLKTPTQNNLQYQLDAQYTSGGTTLTLSQSVAGVVQAPGICVVDRIDTNGSLTPTKRTYYKFTGVSGAQLSGISLADGTDQTHAVGAIVEFVPDVIWAGSIYDGLSQLIDVSTGTLDTTKVVNLSTAQTLTNKTLASPTVVEDMYSLGNLTGAITLDSANGINQFGTLTGSVTITLTTPTSNKKRRTTYFLATGAGSYTISFSTSVTWQDATTPTWTTTASKLNAFTLFYDGSSWWGMGAKFA